MDPELSRTSIDGIVQVLVVAVPSGWERARLDVRQLGWSRERLATVTVGSDTWKPIPHASQPAIEHIDNLRDATASPGTGAWFTAVITVTSDGEVTTEFDYDSEPDIEMPLDLGDFTDELENWPRDPEHIPEWFSRRMEELG